MLLRQGETRLDPRVRRTRQALKRALNELMSEKSFAAITVQDIAARAAINRVTFYAHFRDKFDLLEFALREMFHESLRVRLPEGSPLSAENLGQLIWIVCDFLAEVRGHCPPPHAQFELLMENQIKGELYGVVQAWLTDRLPDTSPSAASPELAAMVASWAIYGAAVQWSRQDPAVPLKEFIQQVQPIILASLQFEGATRSRDGAKRR